MLVAALKGLTVAFTDSSLANLGPLTEEAVVSPEIGRLGVLLLTWVSLVAFVIVEVRCHGLYESVEEMEGANWKQNILWEFSQLSIACTI